MRLCIDEQETWFFRIICILNILIFFLVKLDSWKNNLPTKCMFSLNSGFIAMVILRFIEPSPSMMNADYLYPLIGMFLVAVVFAALQLASMGSLTALTLVSFFFGGILVYGTDTVENWLEVYMSVNITEGWHKVVAVMLVAAAVTAMLVLYYMQRVLRVTLRCVYYGLLVTIAMRSYRTVGFVYSQLCCTSDDWSRCPVWLDSFDYGVWGALFVCRMALYATVKYYSPPDKDHMSEEDKLDLKEQQALIQRHPHVPKNVLRAARYFQGETASIDDEYTLVKDRKRPIRPQSSFVRFQGSANRSYR